MRKNLNSLIILFTLICINQQNIYCQEQSNKKVKYGFLKDIEFPVLLTRANGETYEQSVFPCITMRNYQDFEDKLTNPDEIVLNESSATIIFESPLLTPKKIEINTDKEGFTRRELFKLACENYKRLYDEETAKLSDKKARKKREKGMDQYTFWKIEVFREYKSKINIFPSLTK